MATAAKKPAAKKTPAKKPAPAKKAVQAKKPSPAKQASPKKAAPEKKAKEARLLYTFRLEPSWIDKLKAQAAKEGVTHAAVARTAIVAYFG